MRIVYFFLFAFCIFSSCVTSFQISDLENRAENHERVAILPFEMVFSGERPDGLSEKDIEALEEAESKGFQISMFNELIAHTQRAKNKYDIQVQDYNRTNAILAEHALTFQDAQGLDAQELSDLLGVDLILKGRIHKQRYMSDLESFGIELGVHIISVLTRHHGGIWWISPFATSKEITAHYALQDGSDGKTIWSISFEEEANWSRKSNLIIQEINERAARRFPIYRVLL